MAKSLEILLPTTEKDFDLLIKKLVKKYNLPNEEHAAAVVANRIQHLPVDQATCTLEYLGHCVLKNVAYQVAQSKSKKIQHKIQIEQLDTILKENPFDQQALDALAQAEKDGSEYAREVLSKYTPLADGNVMPLRSSDSCESAG